MLNWGVLSTRLQPPALWGEGLRADPQTQGSSFEMDSPRLPNTHPNSDDLQERLALHPTAKPGTGEGAALYPGVLTPIPPLREEASSRGSV